MAKRPASKKGEGEDAKERLHSLTKGHRSLHTRLAGKPALLTHGIAGHVADAELSSSGNTFLTVVVASCSVALQAPLVQT